MTRRKLAKMKDERKRFSGVFARYGSKPGFDGRPDLPTVLLRNVTDVETGEVVTDHLWLNLTKGFAALDELSQGDVVQFDARVTTYRKGYFGRRDDVCKRPKQDYKLSHPTKIVRVGAGDADGAGYDEPPDVAAALDNLGL